MDNLEIQNLKDRIARTERAFRTWRFVTGAAVAVALLLVVGAIVRQTTAKTIKASEFLLVDGNGRALIRLGEAPGLPGAVSFQLNDNTGRARIVVGVDDGNSPFVALLDADTGDHLSLELKPGKGPAIAFKNGKDRAGRLLTADRAGVTAIAFMDKEGKPLIEMGVNPDSTPQLIVRSREGEKLFEAP